MTAPPAPSGPAMVDALAGVALQNLSREYPYAAHHVQTSAQDLLLPVQLHPSFATSFDWHSSVHMHWLLATLVEVTAERSPAPAWRADALAVLSDHLAAQKLAVEADYLRANPTWERPYGWAWAAQLVQTLATARTPELAALAAGAVPLLDAIADLTLAWLGNTTIPVRHGLHINAAFGLRRLLLVAREAGRSELAAGIEEAARRFYLSDTDWAFHQERSGQDFLSAGLCEADLMILVLDRDELAAWLPRFLSGLTADSEILTPVPVIDPTDGYQSHLDGLGLTAAASGLRIAEALEVLGEQTTRGEHVASGTHTAAALRQAAPTLMAPGLAAAVSDEYMASHWLATFAWEALVAAGKTGQE